MSIPHNREPIQEQNNIVQFFRASLDEPNGIKKASIKISAIALFVLLGSKIAQSLPFIFACPLLGIVSCLSSVIFCYPDEILSLIENAIGTVKKDPLKK
ncbi:MAG: hypothetical protein FJZ60_02650 [Chlamydiae bacterium]|nr:hypothetical protein [Chlamydiota bacterium]